MKITIKLFLIILLISHCTASAQEQWKIIQATELLTGEIFSSSGTFEISNDQIQFIQKNGLIRYDFKITKRSNLIDERTVEFEIIFRGAAGVLRLISGQNESTLILDIRKGAERILPYKFSLKPIS